MPICLPQELADVFLNKLKSGEIDPAKLITMGSKKRHQFFAEFLPENLAVKVNADFESKLLLKNQKAGLVTWAKRASGIKPEVRRDLVARIQRMDEVLTPESEDAFLQDLAAQRLGMSVTAEEAGKISDLASKVTELEANRTRSDEDRLQYGMAMVDFNNYVSGLKAEAKGETKTLGQDWQQFKANPVQKSLRSVLSIPSTARAAKSAMDASFILRQGMKTLFSNPKIWATNSLKGLNVAQKALRGKSIMDVINAEIISRDNYDLYQKAEIGVAVREEEFPTSAPQKLPVIGRGFKASDETFTAQSHLTRADLFDFHYNRAKENGVEVTDKQWLKQMGGFVGQMTGRGKLPGVLEKGADAINVTFFSPRFWASQIQTFTQPVTGARSGFFSGDFGFRDPGTNYIRRQAAKSMLRVVAGQLAIYMLAKAVIGDDAVEEDPRSSNFGRIRVGDTRFDVSGGLSPLVTLVSRLWTQETKSSTSGLISDINSDEFGSSDGWDVVVDYMTNKLSPVGRIGVDLINRKNFSGQPITPTTLAKGLFIPIPVETAVEALDNERAADLWMIMILDGLGVGANTYSSDEDWSQDTSKKISAFKEHIDNESKFKEINEEYNRRFNNWFTKLGSNQEYLSHSNEEKKQIISNKKEEIKDDIYKENGFKYKREKSKKLPSF